MQPMFRRDAAGSHLIELALPFPKSQIEYLSNDHGVKRMKKVILTMASLGMLTLLISMTPDIRRYIRMRLM